MPTEAELIEKLRKIEALYQRPGTDGERAAAANARDRVRARLAVQEPAEPLLEQRMSMPDGWSQRLIVALLRRHGIAPYRIRGQRRTTVMARMTDRFARETLWPQYQQLSALLRAHLAEVTERVIVQAVWRDVGDVAERPDAPPGENAAGAGPGV